MKSFSDICFCTDYPLPKYNSSPNPMILRKIKNTKVIALGSTPMNVRSSGLSLWKQANNQLSNTTDELLRHINSIQLSPILAPRIYTSSTIPHRVGDHLWWHAITIVLVSSCIPLSVCAHLKWASGCHARLHETYHQSLEKLSLLV
jgi:hypothetical protein